MTIDNINLGNSIFYRVKDLQEVNILDEVKHLSEKDAYKTLEHLNALFMNLIINPEVTIFQYSTEQQKKILQHITTANKQLKEITSNIRESKNYWRDIRLNAIL